jgi:hypothetical protein
MLMMTSDGPQWHCAGCRQPIVTAEALALYRPLAGTADATAMMLVHKTCMVCPRIVSTDLNGFICKI